MPRTRDEQLLVEVGRRVAQLRVDRGWTQDALSAAIDIEPVTLSRLENGHRALSLTTLAHIATALNVSLGDLLDPVRQAPSVQVDPDINELARLANGLSPSARDVLLRVARELAKAK